jgi:hypothetical protein
MEFYFAKKTKCQYRENMNVKEPNDYVPYKINQSYICGYTTHTHNTLQHTENNNKFRHKYVTYPYFCL